MKRTQLFALLLALSLLLGLTACGSTQPSAAAPASAGPAEEASSIPEESAAEEPAPAEPAEIAQEESAAEPEDTPEPEPDYDEVFVVVHTNDVHGFIDIEPYVKAVADDYKARYGENNVVTVSAGDVYAGGNAVAHLYNGETIPPIMDAAGYDMIAPGNNDFNLGADQLLVLSAMPEHMKTVCANLYEKLYDENGEPLVDEDGAEVWGESIFDRTMTVTTGSGTRVGLFGLTVQGGAVGDLFGSQSSVEAAQEAVAQLQDAGCTVLVGVGHTGWNDDLVTPSANDVTSAQLVKEVPGIDVFVDGHTHSVIGDGNGWVCPETGTLVNQASCKGECVGIMTLYLKDGVVLEKEARLIMEDELLSEYTPDPEVQALVDAAWARLEGDAGTNYGQSDYFLNALRTSESPDGRSVRTDETNLGDLITDAIRDLTGADIALEPGFHIRASVSEGNIYTINLYDVFANGGSIYLVEMTGQEVLEKMAGSLNDLPAESTQFNQISGASYGYVLGEPGADGMKAFTIVDPTVGGEPLDLEKTYLVAMDAGGPDAPEDQEPILDGMEAMAEAVGDYIASGRAEILPDVPTPDNRIIPMEEIPAGAVTYTVELAAMAPGGPGGAPGGPGGANPPPKP